MRYNVRSGNTIRFGGFNQSGTSRNKVVINFGEDQQVYRYDKIEYCTHCKGRFCCSGIPQEIGDYSSRHFKPSKIFHINYLKEYDECETSDRYDEE
jgi:predicted nucleic acid binding AN1-type Zn finger protein